MAAPAPTMTEEKQYQISPIVPESVVHNTKTLSNYQSVTASLFGVTAGILGLESYAGFLFYLVLSALTILLFHALRVGPDARAAGLSPLDTSRFFRSPWSFWTSGLMAGLPGYILTWTLFYGLVRA